MADTEEAPAEGKRKFDPKTLALGALLIGGAAYFFLLKPTPAPADGAAAAPAPAAMAVVEGDIVEVGAMTVNLSADGLSFARVGMALVLSQPNTSVEIEPRMALFRDGAISEVAQWGPEDLRTPAGHQLLRDGLGEVAAEIWPDGEVVRVVLTELLIQ